MVENYLDIVAVLVIFFLPWHFIIKIRWYWWNYYKK